LKPAATDTQQTSGQAFSAIGALRRSDRLMRNLAAGVALAFTMLILAPTAAEARTVLEKRDPLAVPQTGEEAQLAHLLRQVEERVEQLEARLARGEEASNEQAVLRQLESGLRQPERTIRRNFAAIGDWIDARGLDPVIAQRHRQAVTAFESRLAQLYDQLATLAAARGNSEQLGRSRDVLRWLEQHRSRRTAPSFHPDELSNRAHKPERKVPPRSTPSAFAQAGLHDNPYPKLAALGDFRFDALPSADDPVYLAETPEIVLTQALRERAAALDHDPVKIYHWVRNHIEWLPTWGAWQDAALTLATRRGNSLDIAGLTIALLRASGIPARYVHGTIELPAERFINWVGDFADLGAAWDYASAGGISTAAVSAGGGIVGMRLEHVWVEAAIDYEPSRGARNRVADTSVALDPSYKQYEYLQGLDVNGIAGIDLEQLAQAFIASGIADDREDWIAGFDPTLLQEAQAETQRALAAHIEDTLSNPSMGEVIGGRRAIVQNYPVLPSGLPYKTLVTGVRYGSLPDQLRHRMRFAFHSQTLTYPWAKLNNRCLTLTFRPATEVDEVALQALLPAGEITDPGQLPEHIPAYLIEVVPEMRLDGALIASGDPMGLGEELPFSFHTLHPLETRRPYSYPVVAGSYLAIAVVGQDVSPQSLDSARQRLTHTQTALDSQDPDLIATLTREALLGDMFHSGILSYFAQYNALAHVAALGQRASHSLSMGYGSYGYEPTVDSFFGIPQAIGPGGVVMNVRVGRYLGNHENDPEGLREDKMAGLYFRE
jgi:transglutaminase-like putative cysteine protease